MSGAAVAAARYHWNNAGNPAARAARRLVDTLGPVRQAVRSDDPAFDVSLAYAGLPIGHLNVLRLLERRRTALGGGEPLLRTVPVTWPDLRRGRFPEADIVLVGAEEARVRRLPAARAVIAPFRVHLVVDTSGGRDAVRAAISKRERWEFGRNSRHHDWALVEDGSAEALRFFYQRMHLPTMAARHREQSRTEAFTVARDHILRRGRLFFLTEDGRPVAGVLCHESGGTLTTRLLGVLDGDARHYDSGAFKAVYHLLLGWAADRGVPAVDFYGTEAFVAKGIFQWKRKFGPHVVLPPNHFATKRLYVSVRRDTARVRDFLVANPLLEIGPSGGMRPVYFHDAARAARTEISAKARSLGEARLVDLDEFLDG
ncbi:GNAT family N-acetyltransferase [Planotetraspora sp. GP83]|uniref:GNAT family N-acetyltransferase n=1 Tax=Planotetraspora sp. GP83 TaxID=3156264 RepID=UPI0035134D36